jgi:sugar fermentation stimulation protein A
MQNLQRIPSLLADVQYVFSPPLVEGRLLRRYQRFLADVALEDGRVVTVHCPNSGSMLGCLEPHAPVYCSPRSAPGRRTSLTWEMILINGNWVGINTLIPNILVHQAAEKQVLPLFYGAQRVRREVRLDPHTRLDLMMERTSGLLYVEVKNVTLVRQGIAQFPDAPTMRGVRHLQQLIKLAAKGHGSAMVYVVQRQDASAFAPADDIDSRYAEHYRLARAAGVQIVALEALVTPQRISLMRVLPLLNP